MKKNQLKIGVILSYGTQFVQIAVALLYTPIMLRLLGQNEYGLYQLVFSVVSYLSLLSMGFSSAYIRYYSRFKAQCNEHGVAKLNGMFITIFGVISIICLVCGAILVNNIQIVLGNGLLDNEVETAKILMKLMVFNLAITFLTSVFECNIIAKEKFVFQKTVLLLQNLVSPFLTLPLLIMGKGSIGMVCVTTALTCFKLLLCVYYGIKVLGMHFVFREFDWKLLREMWVFTFFIFLNQIIDQINWSVDRFLIGRIVGTSAVAIYGVGGQLNSMYLQFSTSISNVFVPRINRIVAEGENEFELTKLFTKVGRIQFMVLALILSGFILFGENFVLLWAGREYSESYKVGLWLLAPVTIPLIQNLGIEIQRAKNKHKVRSIVYLFIAIGNIVISIPLIKVYGAVGAAVGTTFSLLLGNGLFMNWYYHKKIGLNMGYFWKKIVSLFPAVAVSMLVGLGISRFFLKEGWIYLLISVILYIFIYGIIVYWFGMNKEEKIMVYSIVKRI